MKHTTRRMNVRRRFSRHLRTLALLTTAACFCPQAEAATITVTSSADASGGTLREAIALANPLGGDTGNFGFIREVRPFERGG
jgi:hypothetical protein